MADRFHFLFSVISGEETIGTYALTAQQLVGKSRSNANVCEIVEPLTDGIEIVGKIKFNVYFDHEGDDGFINALVHLALQVSIV